MKFNFSKPLYLLLVLPLFFASCSKEGPTGPQGETGAAGATGATGATGAQGEPGTANVIYSDWLDVTYEGSDTTGWFAEIDAPQLDDSILNTGTMKVYVNFLSDSANNQLILPLPVINEIYFTGVTIQPYFSNQTITLVSNGNVSSYTDNGNHYFQYRYVLIPGGTAAGRNPKGTVNWNNYAEVKKFLGLKD